MRKVNQCSLVLDHLMKHGSITPQQASGLGIRNLGARVWDLRNMGLFIRQRDGAYFIRKVRKAVRCKVKPGEQIDLFSDIDWNADEGTRDM